MTDSQQHPTIKYMYKGRKSDSTLPNHKAIVSLAPEMVNQDFGFLKVISTQIRKRSGAIYLECECTKCHKTLWVVGSNLTLGKSTQCRGCGSRAQHQRRGHANISSAAVKRLQKRVNAMCQRCTNPNDGSYRNYGARGVQFRFASVAEGIAFILKELPHPTYLHVDIDRINNNGHYEPGNLRLVSRSENLLNKRGNRTVQIRGVDVPRAHAYHVLRTLNPEVKYTQGVVQNLISQGLTYQEIVERWHQPSYKPKGCTILPMPDPDIASRYLTS